VTSRNIRLRLSYELATLLSALCCTAGAAQRLYIAPDGRDAASGRNSNEPFATLGKALQVAVRNSDPEGTFILVAPGTYERQTFVLRLSGPVSPIVIQRGSPDEAPVFDGVAQQGTWLRVRSSAATPLPLTISGITIRRYGMALSLEGPETGEAGVSGVQILDNRFEDIGTAAPPPATAALRLINAQQVRVAGNVFLRINNTGTNARKDCVLLHPIYAAHFSSRNAIEQNTFDDNCGVAIKFRNAASDNLVARNVFRNQALASRVQDWYCDATWRKDCVGERSGECPSWNNRFVDNRDDGPPSAAKALDIRGGGRGYDPSCAVPKSRERFLTR
jgi:hypothetical protein